MTYLDLFFYLQVILLASVVLMTAFVVNGNPVKVCKIVFFFHYQNAQLVRIQAAFNRSAHR